MIKPVKTDLLASLDELTSELKQAVVEREQFRLLVNSVLDYAIFMLDETGRIATWNRGAERLKGYTEAEILGQPYELFFSEEDRRDCKPDKLLRQAMERGPAQEQGWRVRKDGTRFWADITLTAVYDDDGILVGFSKVTRDLTERMQAEWYSRQQEQRYRLLVESVTDYAIYLLDPAGYVMTWNRGAEHHKGYRESEIIGRHFSIFYTPEDRERGLPQQLLGTAHAEGHVENEGWRVRKDGTRFWADVVITALRDPQGNLTGYAKVTRDQTDRKQAESLKDQFLSILSHELRTPINAITGFGSILYDQVLGPMTDEQHLYLGKMLAGADTLLALVDDLLDLSQIQAGKFTLSHRPFDLTETVARILDSLAPLADQRRVQLINEAACGLPALSGDDQRVGQVLTNLVGNAIKFTPADGTIRVRARVDGDVVRCEVQDTGIGIAPTDLPKLFKPFSQVDMSSTRPAGGTGLGLSISKALVEAHEGQIGVISDAGAGSTFWFTLPLEPGRRTES